MITARIIKIHRALHKPEAENLGVKSEIARGIAGNGGDVMDSSGAHSGEVGRRKRSAAQKFRDEILRAQWVPLASHELPALSFAMKPLALVALFVSLASLAFAEDKKPGATKWKITGQLEEACSGSAACPCWFDSKPTKPMCSGNQVLFIEKGNYGKVKLDGLAIAEYGQSPENQTMMESFGNWNFSTNYIDEKASPEQRKALEAIATTVFGESSKNLKTEYAPIARKIEGKNHIITIGNVASFHGMLVEGGLGGSSKITNPPGADPVHHQYSQGKTSKMVYTGSGRIGIGKIPITCLERSLSTATSTRNTPPVSPKRWPRKSRRSNHSSLAAGPVIPSESRVIPLRDLLGCPRNPSRRG